MTRPALTALFSAQTLKAACRDLLVAVSTPHHHAELVAETLTNANLRGVDSHGIQMMVTYLQQIRAGGVTVAATGRVIREDGVCLHYQGENGLGQVVSDHCSNHAIRLAKALGVAVVVAKGSNHFGAGAWWGEKIAREGLLAIVMSNACPAVPPWQGKTPILGTNPLCVAVPSGKGSGRWLLDMATSTVALGKLSHAAHLKQESIPEWWGFLGPDGKPTTRVDEAQRGSPSPFGRYKGSALAMMVEILCSGLSGGAMATELPVYRTGGEPLGLSHTFIAIDPARFLSTHEFADQMDRLADMVKSSEPAAGYDEVLVAGEPEWRAARERTAKGIPVPLALWNKLSAIGATLGVTLPPALA